MSRHPNYKQQSKSIEETKVITKPFKLILINTINSQRFTTDMSEDEANNTVFVMKMAELGMKELLCK